ncbi:MAG: alpha/beta hydrolase [Peptoniphilus harei]|nr:alpha/beta hydrolase [Peptoniphilus harei]
MDKFIKVRDGAKIFVKIMGSGEPLLLLHGNGDDISFFEKQIIVFKKFFKVIAMDTRGHGKSDKNYSLNLEKLSNDVLDILDFLKVEKANILGFSDGANLALTFAKNHPIRVKRLILNSPNKDFSQIKFIPRIASYIFYYNLKILSKIFTGLRNYFSVYKLIFDKIKIVDSDYKKFDFPVLIIAGERDLIYLENFYKIAKKIKKSKLYIIKNHGHKVARTKPDEYNEVVLDFLKREVN